MATFAGVVALALSLQANRCSAADKDRAADRITARLQKKVAALKLESTEKSLERLCLMDYEWEFEQNETITLALPLRSHHGTDDIYLLMRLRRIRKAYQELAVMPKLRASMLIQEQLQIALKEYNLLYEDCLESYDPGLTLDQRRRMGPQFVTSDDGNVKHATLIGRRYQVLGLVLLAGNLQLPRLSGDVQSVARRAIRQYEEMSIAKQYSKAIRVWIITRGSLYSPDTLALGMIGTAADGNSSGGDSPIVSKYQRKIGRLEVDPFDSLWQRFEPRDANENLVKLQYCSDTSEDDLRAILNAVTPQ
ncbi:MAG TPA: hypothetical protein VGN12_02410 [Pirellulales bacterium]